MVSECKKRFWLIIFRLQKKIIILKAKQNYIKQSMKSTFRSKVCIIGNNLTLDLEPLGEEFKLVSWYLCLI